MIALSSLAAVGLLEITTKTELSRNTCTRVLRVSQPSQNHSRSSRHELTRSRGQKCLSAVNRIERYMVPTEQQWWSETSSTMSAHSITDIVSSADLSDPGQASITISYFIRHHDSGMPQDHRDPRIGASNCQMDAMGGEVFRDISHERAKEDHQCAPGKSAGARPGTRNAS